MTHTPTHTEKGLYGAKEQRVPPTHTEKGLYGAKEQRVPPTSSFWRKRAGKRWNIKTGRLPISW